MARKSYPVSLFVLLVLIVAALACNASATNSNDTVEVPTEVPVDAGNDLPATEPVVEPTTETQTEAGGDTDICPEPGDGTLMYRSDEFGYCFLYPADYTYNPNWNIYEYGLTAFSGKPLDPNSFEPVLVSFQVTYNGPAVDVANASDYASKWVAINNYPPEAVSFTPGNLGGNEAVIVEQQPGMLPQQVAYTVVDGRKYTVSMVPTIGSFQGLEDEGQATWDLVTGSIVFFPPTGSHAWVTAGDVCPTASPGNFLHVNELDGMCFLVPDGWSRDLSIGGSTFATGEVLGQLEGFGDIVPRVAVAFHGSQGSSIQEVMQPFVDAGTDPATFKDFTAGGYPGVEYAIPSGPYGQRGAMILSDRGTYSIVANPYDPNMFSESIPVIDGMWDTAVSSLQFFTPWR